MVAVSSGILKACADQNPVCAVCFMHCSTRSGWSRSTAAGQATFEAGSNEDAGLGGEWRNNPTARRGWRSV